MDVIYEPRGKAYEYSPLALNIYRGCDHGCLYCYAPNAIFMDRQEFYNNPRARTGILQKIKNNAERIKGEKKHILMSFTSDPYQSIEKDLRLTRQTIEILNNNNLRYKILTKSSLVKRDIDIISKKNCLVGMTISVNDDNVRKKWEPKADSITKRVNTLKYFHDQGFKTWVSLEPVYNHEEAIKVIKRLTFVDEIKVGPISGYKVNIDWSQFLVDVEAEFKKYKIKFMIKKDLEKYRIR